MFQIHNPEMPLISVIIPLYNKAPHIKRAIDSVLRQTVQNFELIVVDDGSTDEGPSFVLKYDDPRLYLINQQNSGVSSARNNGAKSAKSNLIAFLDADDEWMPEFLETILKLRAIYPKAGLYGGGFLVVDNNIEYSVVCHKELGVRIMDSYYKEKNAHVGLIILATACAVDAGVFESVGGFPENMRRAEDEDFFARVAYVSDVVYNPKILVKVHKNTVNRSTMVLSDMDSPFLEMVSHKYKSGTLFHNDISNLLVYADRLRIGIAVRYMHTDLSKAYMNVNNIISKKYRYLLKVVYFLVKCHLLSPRILSKIIDCRKN